jgi:hypothetical protein
MRSPAKRRNLKPINGAVGTMGVDFRKGDRLQFVRIFGSGLGFDAIELNFYADRVFFRQVPEKFNFNGFGISGIPGKAKVNLIVFLGCDVGVAFFRNHQVRSFDQRVNLSALVLTTFIYIYTRDIIYHGQLVCQVKIQQQLPHDLDPLGGGFVDPDLQAAILRMAVDFIVNELVVRVGKDCSCFPQENVKNVDTGPGSSLFLHLGEHIKFLRNRNQ